MASPETETMLRSAATQHGLYVPSGAFWGGEDIRKMADRGSLQVLLPRVLIVKTKFMDGT